MFATTAERTVIKFLNGIRMRSSRPFSPRSLGTSSINSEKEAFSDRSLYSTKKDFQSISGHRFGAQSLRKEKRVVFIDPDSKLSFVREVDPTELNNIDSKRQNRLKSSRRSAWSQRIPLIGCRCPDERACFSTSQRRPVAACGERAVVFDPGRAPSLRRVERDTDCVQQTLLARVSRKGSS